MVARQKKEELDQILQKGTPFYFDGNREIIVTERLKAVIDPSLLGTDPVPDTTDSEGEE